VPLFWNSPADPGGCASLPLNRATACGGSFSAEKLTDGDVVGAAELKASAPGADAWLQYDYGRR
jgi:hypothetical protein